MVNIKADKTYSIGFQVILVFQLTQHVKDELIMRTLMKYIDCGNLYKNREIFDLKVRKFHHIVDKIIPLFKNTLFMELRLRIFRIDVKSLN